MVGEMKQPLLSIGAVTHAGYGDEDNEEMGEGVEEAKGRYAVMSSSVNLRTVSLPRLLSRKKKLEVPGEEAPLPLESAREQRKSGRIQSFRRRVKSVLVGQSLDLTGPVESIETHVSFPQTLASGRYSDDQQDAAPTKEMADAIATENGKNRQQGKTSSAAQGEERSTISRRRGFFGRLLGRAKSTVVGVTVQDGELELDEEETYGPGLAESDAKEFAAEDATAHVAKSRSKSVPRFLSRKRVAENKAASEPRSLSSSEAQQKPGRFLSRKKGVEDKHANEPRSFSSSDALQKPGRMKSLKARVRSALGMSLLEPEHVRGLDAEGTSPGEGAGPPQPFGANLGEGAEANNNVGAVTWQEPIIDAHSVPWGHSPPRLSYFGGPEDRMVGNVDVQCMECFNGPLAE